MKKKFTKIGNSWAMLFTKTMLEMLDIDPETEQAEIEFDKKSSNGIRCWSLRGHIVARMYRCYSLFI